jgi:hypothetical protein
MDSLSVEKVLTAARDLWAELGTKP